MSMVLKHLDVIPLKKQSDWEEKLRKWVRTPEGRAALTRARARSIESSPAQPQTAIKIARKPLHAVTTPTSQLETIEERAEVTLGELRSFLRRNRKDSIEQEQVKVLAYHLEEALKGNNLPSGSIQKLTPTSSSLRTAHAWQSSGRRTENLDQNAIRKMTADLLREEAIEALSSLTAKTRNQRFSKEPRQVSTLEGNGFSTITSKTNTRSTASNETDSRQWNDLEGRDGKS